MKIIYLANVRMPTEKAHGYQIVRTAAAMVDQGAQVELVVPKRRNPRLGSTNVFTYYGVSTKFPIRWLPSLDLIRGEMNRFIGPLAFWIQTLTFARSVRKYLRTATADWIYGRDELLLDQIADLPEDARLAVELHALPSARYAKLLGRADRVVVITQAIMNGLIAQGVDARKILVAPDAVELDEFSRLPEKSVARALLGWKSEHKIALYVGGPYPWKGVFRLAEASRKLPEPWRVVFVGGQGRDLKPLENMVQDDERKRAQVIPHQERRKIPIYYAAADVLVVPNSPETDRSRLYTSPLKLFEYLAAGRPIVASDLPSIREVVSEREVIFINPSSTPAIVEGILEAGEKDQSARVAAAKELVKSYTWAGRAKIILTALAPLSKR